VTRRALPWIVAAAVLAVDRATKLAVMRCIRPGDAFIVFEGFSITHVHNRGIAFSFFAESGRIGQAVLVALIAVTVAVIAWILWRSGDSIPPAGRAALGAILGGAVGNLVDRLLYGAVVDFLHFWVRVGGKGYAWPDFNVADAAITVGAGALILAELFGHRRPDVETDGEGEA